MAFALPRYAELDVTTNFSFLRGSSHPEELVATAKALGLDAIAITDANTLAGVVRAHLAAKEVGGIKFIVGVRLDLKDAPSLLAYPRDRAAYGRLCRLLTLGQRRAEKGECTLFLADVAAHAEGLIFIAFPSDEGTTARFESQLQHIKTAIGARLYLAARHAYRGDDRARIAALAALGQRTGVPIVATNGVLYHAPHRRSLQDVLTAIREKCTVAEAGLRLEANAERHLKSAQDMARLFAGHEDALARTIEITQACTFSLEELKYEYPDEPVPEGKTPQSHLEDLTWAGAAWRFPDGIPEKVRDTLQKELVLIAELNYAHYFLTVHDIVHYARGLGILCQGRGSAANSAICYCLAITNVDPTEIDLLFERFVSPERKEPPDIDVDFEHERREEVIQYIYARYGRDRAGLAATVICYRGRLAVREVGKALGLSEDTVAALATTIWGLSNSSLPEEYVRQAGLDPSDPLLARCLELTQELIGFPRHLSQHVGGFVLTRGPLSEVVPIGNAAMEDRTVIEWDKDDLDALGLLKVDVLGLGMLTCIRKAFAFLHEHYGKDVTLGTVPRDDPLVYDMLCKADSIGVFQVESRAQMNMLPRLKPRVFYDIVIEVAIVRPGPIQGDMVHPYLRRRCGDEPVNFPSPHPDHGPADELRQVLGKTMGVPLFQEQAMRLAMVAAKFTGAEANELRRAMATFRRRGTIDRLREKMVGRMMGRGYPAEFAERCFNQIKGFGEYGFPESHAASFAHLVYISAWIKCHYPAAFAAALLNSQPMGFYAPAQIVRCAREHGVEAREADVNHSLWDCTLEEARGDAFALRLGLRQIDGLREDDVKCLVSVRDSIPAELNPHLFAPALLSSPGLTGRSSNPRPLDNEDQELLDARLRGHDTEKRFNDARDLWRRSGVSRRSLENLAAADAFRSLGLDRRQALWEVRGLPRELPLPLFDHADTAEAGTEPEVALPVMTLSEHVVNDYRTLRLSLKAHPMSFLRARVAAARISSCANLKTCRDGARVSVAGVVLVRQRPGSAQGVVFMTIEDETGVANSVIWPKVLESERKVVMGARLVVVHGRVQRHEDIIHVVAARLDDRSDWLRLLTEDGESLSVAPAHADEVKRPDPGSWRFVHKEEDVPLPFAPAGHVKRPLPGRERPHPRWHPPPSPLRAHHPEIPRLPLVVRGVVSPAKAAMLPAMTSRLLSIVATLALLLAFGAPALRAFEQPEAPSGFLPKPLVKAKRHMVVAAHPLAAEAGLAILRKGGNALDAAIATQMVLNLVEPQSSGIGGGTFFLYWDAAKKQLASFDGRETAPASATPELFLDKDGKPLPRDAAMASGLSVGAPGVLAVLKLAHDKFGKLPWAELFEPAIALSREGFPISPRLAKLLAGTGPQSFTPEARAYFFDAEGRPWPEGYKLANPALGETFATIAQGGSKPFYDGDIARDIANAVQTDSRIPGKLRVEDLASYRAKERVPVCILYRVDRVCGPGPPSSGGVTVGQVLALVAPYDLGSTPLGAGAVHIIVEAERLALADRARYLADTDFVPAPVAGLLDPAYIAERRALIAPDHAQANVAAGSPPNTRQGSFGLDATQEAAGTSQISIIDDDGNALSMTTTIEQAFGSRTMVRGFLLNNQLTDFSFLPVDEEGRVVANRVEGGKRPRSSLDPSIVFGEDGQLLYVLGSPGGTAIILYNVKAIVALIDWRLDPAKASALVNFSVAENTVLLEPGPEWDKLATSLQAMGHDVHRVDLTSGEHIIAVTPDGLEGGADPRREGVALGD